MVQPDPPFEVQQHVPSLRLLLSVPESESRWWYLLLGPVGVVVSLCSGLELRYRRLSLSSVCYQTFSALLEMLIGKRPTTKRQCGMRNQK